MGLFDAITGSVIMKYKVETDAAKAKIKELSGEQKKAAKEAAEALEKQGKAAESMASQYAKGAAIIVAGIAVARSGWKAYREETSMVAATAGVSIDRLSTAYDGLKTRTELLTLAQAGHQGAWKLTTAQLEQVITGMRSLEAKGYDAQQVFDKFTDVLKKGKTEGLDDFGLSIKSTGDKTQDLKILMNALSKEALDVGGNFASAGDEVARAAVRMEDGIARVRIEIGRAVNGILDMAAAAGAMAGKAVFGSGPADVGTGGRVDVYARAFQARRGATAYLSGSRAGGATGVVDRLAGMLPGPTFDRMMFGGPSGADVAAARTLSTFKSAINQGMQGWGPLASASPEEFAKAVAGLPKDWEKVDAALASQVDDLRKKSGAKWMTSMFWWGVDGRKAVAKGVAGNRRGGGGRGRASAGDPTATVFDDILGTAGGFYNFALGQAAANDAAFASDRDAYNARMTQRFNDAQMVQDLTAQQDAMVKGQRESFLERTFGKLEQFDQYGAAFATLKGAVTDGFQAWITGAESVGTAVRRSIAQALGGYAIEMAGMALVAGAHGLYHMFIPGMQAQGTGELLAAAKYTAAAVALGGLAKLVSPGGGGVPATGGASTGGGHTQDHRGAGAGQGTQVIGSNSSIVFGSAFDDDSRRYRERAAARALNTPTAYQPPRGVAA